MRKGIAKGERARRRSSMVKGCAVRSGFRGSQRLCVQGRFNIDEVMTKSGILTEWIWFCATNDVLYAMRTFRLNASGCVSH